MSVRMIAIKEPRLEVLRPSVDGFHHARAHRYRQGEYSASGYYEDAFNHAAVIECVLGPLSRDQFPVQCRQVSHDVRGNTEIERILRDAGPASLE